MSHPRRSQHRTRGILSIVPGLLLVGLLTTACRREVRTYRVAKVPPATTAAADDLVAEELAWKEPDGWVEVDVKSSLRIRGYRVGGPESEVLVTIVVLRGDGGGLTANVNRWRRSLGLRTVSEAQVEEYVAKLTTPVGPAQIVDAAGMTASAPPRGQGIMAAIVPYGKRTWFIKCAGPRSWMIQHGRNEIIALLQSLHPARADP